MRIIFLNSLFGKIEKPYLEYIKKESKKTDVFCFTEYSPELFEKVSKMLPGWNGFLERGIFLKFVGGIDCLAIFVKNKYKSTSSGKINLYRNIITDTGFASYVTIKIPNGELLIVNVHGKARPGHKKDTPVRVKQSQKIIDFCNKHKGLKIVGGDFNLMPDTKSVKMFENVGYKNLIKEFGIKSTRNKVSWEQFKKQPGFTKQYFADYVFTSPEININYFDVPYMEISDHLPQILEFDI